MMLITRNGNFIFAKDENYTEHFIYDVDVFVLSSSTWWYSQKGLTPLITIIQFE